jgi:hypothetical protein
MFVYLKQTQFAIYVAKGISCLNMMEVLVRDKPRIGEKRRKGFTFKRNADMEFDFFSFLDSTQWLGGGSSPHSLHAR